MKEVTFTKTCHDCNVEIEYTTMDFTQEQGWATKIDMDFMWGKEFECSECWKTYYLSDDIDWYIEDKEWNQVY